MDALYLLSYRGRTQTAFEVYHRHFALTINIKTGVIDYRFVFYYNAQVLIMRGHTMRKLSAFIMACIMTVAAFTGCGLRFKEPEVDMSSLTVCKEDAFISALEKVGVPKEKHTIHRDHAFKFTEEETAYTYEYCLEATADNENYFSYVRCFDEAVAKSLFEHYYTKYKEVWSAKGFFGIHSESSDASSGYVLISGKLNEKDGKTYIAYHDALYFKDKTVIIMMASDNRSDIERQIDNLCKEIGCQNP